MMAILAATASQALSTVLWGVGAAEPSTCVWAIYQLFSTKLNVTINEANTLTELFAYLLSA